MIEREEAEDACTQAQQHLEKTETNWESQQADLIAEQKTLQETLTVVEQEKSELLPSINADDLATYQNLRRRKGGLAVTQANGDACGICGMAISPNLKWQLREKGIGHCSNCERIIVRI